MRQNLGLQSARVFLLVVGVLAYANAAVADGGRLRFRREAGPFVVTFFTTPDPLSRGPADFSVAVQRLGTRGLVEDAHVEFILTSVNSRGKRLVLHASHAAATSKWLQASNFSIPAQGLWHVTIRVRCGRQVGQCSGKVDVRAAGPRSLVWDVLPVPLAGLLLLVHLNRKQKYSRECRSRRTAADT